MIRQIIGSLIMLVVFIVIIVLVIMGFQANWKWQNDYFNYWQLSDKASTISQKSEYVDKFVGALENSGLQGQNSHLIWKTNNSSFDQNMLALKSLQSRLQEIKTLDQNSFAYQTAIQQITEQEQGQADEMLGVIESCWWRVHYYYFWNGWILFGIIGVLFLFAIIRGALAFYDKY